MSRYKIRVDIPHDYPVSEPKVHMLDSSIPRKDDFHCDPDGVCCITVFEE